LLARLPNSRRSARMADRLRPLVTVRPAAGARNPARAKGPTGATAPTARVEPALPSSGRWNSGTPVAGPLTVGRPDSPDAAARRDGVTDDAPAGMGLSAWWVVQLVAGAPLSFWETELGLDPAE